MGGKTGTTTSSVAIPPEVLARYNAVNTQAQATAGTPFQQYSTDPNAFVAPLNQEQNAATAQTNQYANAAQPSIAYAQQGYTPEGFQQGVQGYMNPFLQNAMGSTAAQMNNVNQQQQQQMMGSAIGAGAFGGDRANIGLGALENQQNLVEGQTLGNMASQGFQSAAQNYQTGLGQIGALGVQGQQAGLQGAQAMLGAGTLGQQTTQAGQSALYNQFQQQQAYPFQVAQFLANIAEGTGALSGSTTTTAAPQSFFSDARLKEDIKRVGTAKNGLPIYTFKYKGDDTEQTHTGYMAQDVEKVHPEAVGESNGFKTVNYEQASKPVHRAFGGLNLNPASTLMGGMGQGSQDPLVLPPVNGGVVPNGNHNGHDNVEHGSFGFSDMGGQQASDRSDGAWARGGAANSEGGVVAPQHAAEGYFNGGDVVSPYDLSAILAAQKESYAPFQQGGIYGGQAGGTPGGKSYVPSASLAVPHLGVASAASGQHGDTLMGDLQQATSGADTVKKAYGYGQDIIGHPATAAKAAIPADPKTGAAAVAAVPAQNATGLEWLKTLGQPQGQAHGGVVGYADGGGVEPYQTDDPMSQVVSDTEKDKGQHGLMTAQTPTGQSSSTLGDLSKIAAIPGEISGLGTMASTIGSGVGAAASGIGSFLSSLGPFALALKDGGVAEREHHADGDRVGDAPAGGVVAPADDSFDTSNDGFTSAVPQHWKPLLSAIKQPESGGQYDIQNGGKGRVDLNAPHPGVVGPDGTSTATGAYQFVKDTWDRTTGNAPMTPKNQDAAAIKLASQDYNKRTGRDLDADLQSNGVTPEMKAALSPTWAGLADRPAPNAAPAASQLNDGKGGFQAPDGDQPQQPSPLKGIGDALMSEQFLIPLLSGIGTMAGSNSRYLGAAILQGIGGGAKAYEDVQSNLAQRGLTNAQRDVQSTLAAGNAQTVAQNAFFKGPDGQTYAMTPQGPMLQGLWTQALAQGKYIPTVGYDQMIQMISKIPGAQPIAQGNAAQPTDPNAPRPTQAVPGMPTGNEPAPPPNPYTGVGSAGNAKFNTTYQQSFLDQPTFQTAKAQSDKIEEDTRLAAENAKTQGGTLNQLASTILRTNPNSWNATGVNNEYTNNVSNYWNDLVSRLGGSMGANAEQLKGWKLNPEEVGSKQAADKISGMLQFAQLNSNDTHSLGALQTAGRVIPSTANSYEGAVDILSGLFADKQVTIDKNAYLQEYKKLASQKSPVFANRYLAQDALQSFGSDHSSNQYGTEKERLKKVLAARTPDGGSLFDKLYSGGKPDNTLDEKLPGMGRYIRNN